MRYIIIKLFIRASIFFNNKGTLVGDIVISAKELAVRNLEVAFEEITVKGDVTTIFGEQNQTTTNLRLPSLDLDRLFFQEKDAKDLLIEQHGFPQQRLEPENTIVQNTAFGLPKDSRILLNLTIDNLTYSKQALKQFQMNAEISAGNVKVQSLTVNGLPGEAIAQCSGTFLLETAENEPQKFIGTIKTSGKDILPLLAWLGVETANLPQNKFKNFDITAEVSTSVNDIHIKRIDLKIDESTLLAQAKIKLGDRISSTAAIKLDMINLDNYFSKSTTVEAPTDLNASFRMFDLLRRVDLIFDKVAFSL